MVRRPRSTCCCCWPTGGPPRWKPRSGARALSEIYRGRERQLRETAGKLYWDAGKRLYADTPRKQQFSQHTNTLAVLADVIAGDAGARPGVAHPHARRAWRRPGSSSASMCICALAKVGEGDRYLDLLGDWRDMLGRGLTTFAEIVDRPNSPSRSDCHAWSASPNIEIFRTVLGVDSAAPGFRRVAVRPHLGKLGSVSGTVPHPAGEIEVRIAPGGGVFEAAVTLPPGIAGEFEWHGVRRDLAPGTNRFQIPRG